MINQGDDCIDGFTKNGIVCLGQLFSNTEVESICKAFEDLVRNPVEGVGVIHESNEKTVRSIMGWQRATGQLSSFASDQRILEPVKDILGESIEFHQTKYNSKSPDSDGGEKWDAHRGDTFWCIKDGVPDPSKILTVFIALTDQTERNGAVFAWEGSHTVSLEAIKEKIDGLEDEGDLGKDTAPYLSIQIREEELQGFHDEFKKVALEGVAGTVWILDAGLLHASGLNTSDKTRILVANVFRATDNRPKHPRHLHYLAEPANGSL